MQMEVNDLICGFGVNTDVSSLLPYLDDYIFAEGCHNEIGEEEARIAFTAFFLSMVSADAGSPGLVESIHVLTL